MSNYRMLTVKKTSVIDINFFILLLDHAIGAFVDDQNFYANSFSLISQMKSGKAEYDVPLCLFAFQICLIISPCSCWLIVGIES